MVNYKAIVSIVKKKTKTSGTPCKKKLQKIVFLIEAKHDNLGCDYGIHFYGPYSADLDYAIRDLCNEGVLKIEYTDMEHKISVADDSAVAAYSDSIINDVIENFGRETPSELELIATALYIYLRTNDIDRITNGVIKLKGAKYSEDRINKAIEKLIRNNYIAA